MNTHTYISAAARRCCRHRARVQRRPGMAAPNNDNNHHDK